MTLFAYKNNVLEGQGRYITEYQTKLKKKVRFTLKSFKMNPILLANNNVTFYALFSLIYY